MRTVLRTALPLVAAIALTWGLARATAAQSSIPNGVFVRNSEGLVWLVLEGERIKIPVWQATDEEIAAVPVFDRWAVMDAVGAIVAGDRPAWLVDDVAPAPPAPVASATPTRTPRPAPTATPQPQRRTDDPVRLSGERSQNTKAFSLSGGNYTATWDIKVARGSTSCYGSASLYRVEGKQYIEQLFSALLNDDRGKSADGETQLYGLNAGQYYLDINSGCPWSVEIRPS